MHLSGVRLSEYKGLKGCELVGLGRINVICGRNNSGKSTVLEALNTPTLRTAAASFTKDNVRQLIVGLNTSLTDDKIPEQTPFYQAMEGCVTKAAALRRWYAGQADDFALALKEQMRHDGQLHSIGWRRDNVTRMYDHLFSALPTILLVPPKRTLQPVVEIKTYEPVAPTGEGVLNKLFYFSTQHPHSPQWKSYSTVAEAFTSITDGFSIHVTTSSRENQIALSFSPPGSEYALPAEACGLGLRDILILLYVAIIDPADILLVEELENHLHPEIQRKLLRFFRDSTTKQYILSTHSSVLLDPMLVDKALFASFKEGVQISDVTSRAKTLSALGYSVVDNLVSDMIILVEGPSDVEVYQELFHQMGLLATYNIKFWPLGGTNMSEVDLSVFAQSHNVRAIIDKDPESDANRKRFIAHCRKYSIPVKRLERYSIENYFSLDAIKQVLGEKIKSYPKVIDPDKKVAKQLGGHSIKSKNLEIIQAMTLDDLSGSDLLRWLREVEKSLTQL